tara:strand:- start:42 stop:428 length:387 start_codon:yes stop_codon:yes gene_type:complete
MGKRIIRMKITAISVAALLTATSASAMDFPVAGQTISIGANTDINYTTGIEEWEWELTPSAGLTAMGVGFTMATDIDMLALDEGDIFQGLDFTVDYEVPNTNISFYTEVSTDSDLEFGDITVGATASF